MANKLTCPGCGAHLSAVWQAFTEGHPCPSCGDDLNGVQITTEIIAAQFTGEPDDWNRWLAEHDAKVRAEAAGQALREATYRARARTGRLAQGRANLPRTDPPAEGVRGEFCSACGRGRKEQTSD
jgi:uncharacterized protein (UPF0212 family)